MRALELVHSRIFQQTPRPSSSFILAAMFECIAAFVALNTLPIVFPLALSKEMNCEKSSLTATGAVMEFSLDGDSSDEEEENNKAFGEIPLLDAFLLCGASPGQVYE
jgi:hypothetical protein